MLKEMICTAVLLAVLGFCACAAEKPDVSARAAVLMAADTGEVLYAKNEHERLGVASTTKIMTALLTLERATPDRVVTATPEMVNVEGTSMGLQVGDRVSFRDLVIGMLLPSGNDAANTAALAIAGSAQVFAGMMNQKAKQLGMRDTHFVTPSGLDDNNHFSTAYDMALLGCYAMQNPLFVQICSSQKATVRFENESFDRTYRNHNRLLRTLSGALGVKTGYTKKSGRCLVSAAERNGVLLVCVTLNAPNDWADHEKLFDYGFSLVHRGTIPAATATVPVFGTAVNCVNVCAARALSVTTQTDCSRFQVRVLTQPYCFAPVEKGQVLGTMAVYDGNRCVASTPLLSETELPAVTKEISRSRRFDRLIRFFQQIKQHFFGGRVTYGGQYHQTA